ncbi:MAG TPA: CPBP family intramembrane metalloprotease [Flavobacteriales bacterium]|nr:CPBP family intramembrane metalloprotease [Flavobacteriales bacterium]
MEGPSAPGKPQPELPRFLPPGLEMSRGLLYFALVFMVFMFLQMATLIWRVLALSPDLMANGFSLALLDTPAFQARWMELGSNGDVLAMVSLVADGLGLCLLLWLVYRWKRKRTGFFLALGVAPVRTFLIWTGFFLVLFAALEGLALLLPEMNSEFMHNVLTSATNYPLLFLGLALMPALFEEFLLRGLLYGSLRHVVDKHVAVAIVAGVFTLVHQQYDWYILLLYVLPFGIFLGYARANSGSIWVSVFLHLLNNVASMLLPTGP